MKLPDRDEGFAALVRDLVVAAEQLAGG
jgi:hypothetical protein